MPETKYFIPLENNPEVFNPLAYTLGLSKDLAFHDLYSLDEEATAHIPRPAHAILAIFPPTPTWLAFRAAEEAKLKPYTAKGEDQPVLWMRQTIVNSCGLMGMVHCILNGRPAKDYVVSGSPLETLRKDALPLGPDERPKLLENSEVIETAYSEAAERGDTAAPSRYEEPRYHFVAFVRGDDGHLYEMEGARKGPVDRGLIQENEDLLSPRVIEMAVKNVMTREQEQGAGDMMFSCTVLAPAE